MRINIKEILEDCGLEEAMYPGKRVIQKLPQPGEHKSHCVVYDWRAPDTLRLEVKAGLSGKDMNKKDLAKYPVSFQARTYIDIGTSANGFREEEEESGEDGETGSASGSGSGGKKIGAKKNPFHAFSQVVEGRIPDAGDIKKLVVMGKEIAKEAYKTVLECITAQIRNLTIVPVNILAAVNAVKVTVAMPGGRPREELARSQIEGKATYKPKDMFGVT